MKVKRRRESRIREVAITAEKRELTLSLAFYLDRQKLRPAGVLICTHKVSGGGGVQGEGRTKAGGCSKTEIEMSPGKVIFLLFNSTTNWMKRPFNS